MSNYKDEQKARQEALARLTIQQAVARESDKFFEKAIVPANKLWVAFGEGKKGMTQVRNLENIAYSTDRLSDIYDFLKKQMGRPGKLGEHWRHEGVGRELLDSLTWLRKQARKIANDVKDKHAQGVNDDTERQIHLTLCREYVKHVAAHYQYAGVPNE